ncbi:hypothetical protein Bca4012_102092 [Brassica carinata]
MGIYGMVTGKAGKSGFGSASTAEDVTQSIDANHLTAIVTGGTSGIGLEAARVLGMRGAHVIIAARNTKAANESKEMILKMNPNARIDYIQLDLSSIKSVRSFVHQFLALNLPLNILINNAGVMFCPFQLTEDGIESQFATNHIGWEMIALVIGLITPLRKLIIGNGAPLGVLQDSVTLVGDGAIPAMTLIIGGNLLKGMRSSGMKKSTIIGVLVARYILLPISGVLIVRGAYKLDLITSEPLYQFVLLIQYAVPPAMNLGTITQLFGAGESECSVVMLWTYALASVSLTAWPTFFMWLVA